MGQRVYHYLARTLVITNLPEEMDDETVWSVLEVARHPTLLEKRLVRDPLAFGSRAAVLVFPDPKRATVLAATLSLQLAGTGCSALLLAHYLTLYAQMEKAHIARYGKEPEESQLVVSNINPNLTPIPRYLESMFSTVGCVESADLYPEGDSVVQYACGSEAQTAEFAFDDLNMGGHTLSAKRTLVPDYKIPRFILPADPEVAEPEPEPVLERRCLDVFKEFDRARGPSFSKSRSKKSNQADPTPIGHRQHVLRLPPTVSRLIHVEQNYSPPETVNFHRYRVRRRLPASPLDVEPKKEEGAGDRQEVHAAEISLSEGVENLTLSETHEDRKSLSDDGQIAETRPATKDVSVSAALEPPYLESAEPLNVREYFEQLDAWLRDMKGNDFGLSPSDFESFGQYEETARKQIFEAYMASRATGGELEEAAAGEETSEILKLLASRNYIMKQMVSEDERDEDSDSKDSSETKDDGTQ